MNEQENWQESKSQVFSEQNDLKQFKSKNQNRFEQLTKHEIKILGFIAHEMDVSVIATLLELPEEDIKGDVLSIHQKLSIHDLTGCIKYALAFDLMRF